MLKIIAGSSLKSYRGQHQSTYHDTESGGLPVFQRPQNPETDIDSVVVIPQNMIEDVVARTEQIMSTKSELRAMILNGMDPQEAYKKYRLF